MKFKRLVTSIQASFDEFVTAVENHEAIAAPAIADAREVVARLRAHKSQMDSRISRQKAQALVLTKQRDRWQKRALESTTNDPEKGLLWLRQRDVAATALQQLEQQMATQTQLAADLDAGLTQAELRLATLQNAQNKTKPADKAEQ